MAHEFARESARIVARFKEAKRKGEGFDEFGNWNTIFSGTSYLDGYPNTLIQMASLPPGFPQVPYLQTKHEFSKPRTRTDFDMLPSVREVTLPELTDSRKHRLRTCFIMQISWGVSDKLLVKDFKQWLKLKRPYAPEEKRGVSRTRSYFADLKALGAYRLLKALTAEEALAFTAKFVPGGLYSKIPDWYEAKRRASFILNTYFRDALTRRQVMRRLNSELRERMYSRKKRSF